MEIFFPSEGTEKLACVNGKMDGAIYSLVLEENLLSFAKSLRLEWTLT